RDRAASRSPARELISGRTGSGLSGTNGASSSHGASPEVSPDGRAQAQLVPASAPEGAGFLAARERRADPAGAVDAVPQGDDGRLSELHQGHSAGRPGGEGNEARRPRAP